MKFTSEDLMKAMGLKIGDRVKITFETHSCIDDKVYTEERIVNIVSDVCFGVGIEHDGVINPIIKLVDRNLEILPRPKRVGELKCGEIRENKECYKCPLRSICATLPTGSKKTLYDMLETYKLDKCSYSDQEIYDLLKARLDKEVVEE